ncbi:hypothetical protein ACWEKJ_21145 [Amycolatopsis thermoflava]
MAAERLDDFTVLVARPAAHLQPLIDFDAFTSPPAAQLSRIEAVARAFHLFGRYLMVDAAEISEPIRFGAAGPLGELANRLSDPVDLLDNDYPSGTSIRWRPSVSSRCRRFWTSFGWSGRSGRPSC